MYRRTLVSSVLTPTTRRRRRPTAAAHASGANAFQASGRVSGIWHYPESIPRVKGVAQAGERAVTLALESGEAVTVTARPGTAISPDGGLLTDWRNDGPIYLIPSPHHRWQAKVWLGLYGGEPDTEEARFDKYLMGLPSITEVDWTGEVLTLTYLTPDGQRHFTEFTGDVTANFTWDPSDGGFTRSPLRVAIQEEESGTAYVIGFRVDHTPEGYAALRTLGWAAPLPEVHSKREA